MISSILLVISVAFSGVYANKAIKADTITLTERFYIGFRGSQLGNISHLNSESKLSMKISRRHQKQYVNFVPISSKLLSLPWEAASNLDS